MTEKVEFYFWWNLHFSW